MNITRERDFYLIFISFLIKSPNGLTMEELNKKSLDLLVDLGHITRQDANNEHQIPNNVGSHRKNGIFQQFPMIYDEKHPEHKNRLLYKATEYGVKFFNDNIDTFNLIHTAKYPMYQLEVDKVFGKYTAKYKALATKGSNAEKDEVISVGVNSDIAHITETDDDVIDVQYWKDMAKQDAWVSHPKIGKLKLMDARQMSDGKDVAILVDNGNLYSVKWLLTRKEDIFV